MRFLGLLLAAAFVLVQTSRAQAPAPAPHNVGTISELMAKIIYPTSDAIFYIPTRTPANDHEWGELESKVLTLGEMANLLMTPNRAFDEDKWMKDAQLLLDVGLKAYKLTKEKDVEGLTNLNDELYNSCVTCHADYRPNYRRRN